jgi:hypothetical protein
MPDDTDTTSTTNHLYDNPDLNSLEFLEAVMRSPELDINDRIKAADALLPYYQPKPKPQPSIRPLYTNGIPGDQDVTIKIVIGGLPPDAPVAVEHDTSAGVNDKDLDPWRVPPLN